MLGVQQLCGVKGIVHVHGPGRPEHIHLTICTLCSQSLFFFESDVLEDQTTTVFNEMRKAQACATCGISFSG